MSGLEQDSGLQPNESLAQQIMDRSKSAFEVLAGLLHKDRSELYVAEHEHEDVKVLEAALGRFAAAHLDEGLEQIPELPVPEEVKEASDVMAARILKGKLNWAIYDQYGRREAAAISELLVNKTIIATSLRYGHGHSDGYGMTSGSTKQRRDLTAVGKLYWVEPSQGTIWLGEQYDRYEVDLWGHSLDLGKRKEGVIEQQSELFIVDGLDFATPPRIGQLATFVAQLDASTTRTT